LARSEKFTNELAAEIQRDGGTAAAFPVNIADEESTKRALKDITKQFGTKCAAAIFNASGRPFPKPFQWQAEADLTQGLDITL
jgi:NAD(P)-dependent dehydrogenase (short-subunit alcohol dehydrogenase family)